MFQLVGRGGIKGSWKTAVLRSSRRCISCQTGKQHDPLNILFCGADEFSIYSLRALRRLQDDRPDKIASIDVVCRPDKRVGRGLKQIQQVPIKSVATDFGLRLHQIDTFRGWSPPHTISLVVAVSFGLLVPARILTEAKYGGLNVHPSMLPDLRGPAPITHTLLKRRSHTGVTLQTMHPIKFDHGSILAQTSAPGLPVPPECTPDDLSKLLGPLGADMLCQGVADGIFVPPVRDVREDGTEAATLQHAPKIKPQDRRLDWHSWTADDILLRDRVLGRLWDTETYSRCFPGKPSKRITFDGPWYVDSSVTESAEPGHSVLLHNTPGREAIMGLATADGKIVSPSAATIEGEPKGTALGTLRNGLRVIGI